VLLLGVTYKADISDQRETPAVPIAQKLLEHGAEVRFHDPFVEHWAGGGLDLTCEPELEEAVTKSDITVLLQRHAGYDLDYIAAHAPLVLDTRGAMTKSSTVERL
jgi:UDP-N-acetyl-D-glucosamine dehydrogenase